MIRFDVAGVPAQQGSKKAYVVGGRAVLVDDNKDDLKAWRRKVNAAAQVAMFAAHPLDGPVKVALAFAMPRGKTVKREWPSTTPDLDKLIRAVLDGLTGAVFGDDRQVVALDVIETYSARPGVAVVVSPINNNALAQWRARNER